MADPGSRVAVEVAIKGNLLCILGELTTHARIDADGRWGLDADRIRIILELSTQSPEIGARVDAEDIGAGDQGLMFGYACRETPTLMPLPITLSHALMARHWEYRQTPEGQLLGPDAKAQVTVR